jgi:hypothetical protein
MKGFVKSIILVFLFTVAACVALEAQNITINLDSLSIQNATVKKDTFVYVFSINDARNYNSPTPANATAKYSESVVAFSVAVKKYGITEYKKLQTKIKAESDAQDDTIKALQKMKQEYNDKINAMIEQRKKERDEIKKAN